MPKKLSILRAIARDAKGTPKIVVKGRRAKHLGEGTGSLFLWPIQAVAKKLKGKKAVNTALYEKLHRPLLNVDQKAGRVLEREFGTKKLFRQVDVLPAGRKINGIEAQIRHERHSATAPISKAVSAVTPIAALLYASNLMNKTGSDMSEEPIGDKALLSKVAGALDYADKRIGAEKLAYEMVETGRLNPFQTWDQFNEKVASIMERDLEVVREALSMESPAADFGKLASGNSPAGSSPESVFLHTLASE